MTGLVGRIVWHFFGVYRVTGEMLDETAAVIATGGVL